MIPTRQLQKAVVDVLKQFNGYKVYFSDVKEVNTPSFYVDTTEVTQTVDGTYIDRGIQIDIAYIPVRNSKGEINKADLYITLDALDERIRPIFYVNDRAITVLTAEKTIVDDVAHYIFTLNFTDNFTQGTQPPYMNTLKLEV